MKVTPTKEWGPIAGSDGKVCNPGEVLDCSDVIAERLLQRGKVDLIEEVTLAPRVRLIPSPPAHVEALGLVTRDKKSKQREKKNESNSD
jgi:hypothetical protein